MVEGVLRSSPRADKDVDALLASFSEQLAPLYVAAFGCASFDLGWERQLLWGKGAARKELPSPFWFPTLYMESETGKFQAGWRQRWKEECWYFFLHLWDQRSSFSPGRRAAIYLNGDLLFEMQFSDKETSLRKEVRQRLHQVAVTLHGENLLYLNDNALGDVSAHQKLQWHLAYQDALTSSAPIRHE